MIKMAYLGYSIPEKFNQRTVFLIDILLGIYPSNFDVRQTAQKAQFFN